MNRLLACLTVVALLLGCQKATDVKEATVAEVAAYVKSGTATICDANDGEYRKVAGVVPGAVLLSNFAEYDVKATLPADKSRPLVFYCTSRS